MQTKKNIQSIQSLKVNVQLANEQSKLSEGSLTATSNTSFSSREDASPAANSSRSAGTGVDFIPSVALSKWKLTNYSSPIFSRDLDGNTQRAGRTASAIGDGSHSYEDPNVDSDTSSVSFPSPFSTNERRDRFFLSDEDEEHTLLRERARKISPLISGPTPSTPGSNQLNDSSGQFRVSNVSSTLHEESVPSQKSASKSSRSKGGKPHLKRVDGPFEITAPSRETTKSTSGNSSQSVLDPLRAPLPPTSRSQKGFQKRPLSRSQNVTVLRQQNADRNPLPPTSLKEPTRPNLRHSKSSSSILDYRSSFSSSLIHQTGKPQPSALMPQAQQINTTENSTTDTIELPSQSKQIAAPPKRTESWIDPEAFTERKEIWKTQLQQKDKQLIYLLKREEARISKFRTSLESWKLLDTRRRETTQILLSICAEHNIPAPSIEKMVEYIEECYELLPKNIMTAPLFRHKSEHESFLETHGILHKVLHDVKYVKDETATIRRDRKFILHDVIETLENQNRQIVSAIKIADKKEGSAQTDEVSFLDISPHGFNGSSKFLQDAARRTHRRDFAHFFSEDLEVSEILDDHSVLHFLHEMPSPAERPTKYDHEQEAVEERHQKVLAQLNYFEDEYLRERTIFKREKEANSNLLSSLRQQLLETDGKKKTLINIQIEKMESTLLQVEEQHQNSINLLVHRIKETKEENERILKEKEVIMKQAQFYKRIGQDAVKKHGKKQLGPQGFIALMFTDVQHSSILWATLGDVMGEALVIHNNVISRIFEETKGYFVKAIGDAYLLAYSNIEKAVECAMRIQLELLEADWPEALLQHEDGKEVRDENGNILFRGLRVRVGVHAGTPIHAVDPYTGLSDYFGEVTNVTSSVEGTAKFGGQVAVSQPVWEHIEDTLYFDSTGPIHVAECRSHVELKGAREPTVIRLIVPKKLARRQYPKIDMRLDEKYEHLKRAIQKMRLQMDLLRTMLNKKEEESSKHRAAAAAHIQEEETTANLLRQVESMKVSKQEEFGTMQAILAKQAEVNHLEKSILHKEKNKVTKQLKKLEEELQSLRTQHMTLVREKSLLEIQNLTNIAKIQNLNTQVRQLRKEWDENKDELTDQIDMEKEISSIHEANKMRLLTEISDLTDQVETLKSEKHEFMLQAEHATVRLKRLKQSIEELQHGHQQLVKDAVHFRATAHERVNEAKQSFYAQKSEIANLRAYIETIQKSKETTIAELGDVNRILLSDIASIMLKHNRDDPHLQRYLEEHWSPLLHHDRTQEDKSLYMSHEDEERRIVEVMHRSHAQLRSLLHELQKVALNRDAMEQRFHTLNEHYVAQQKKVAATDTETNNYRSKTWIPSFHLPPFVIEGSLSDPYDENTPDSHPSSGKNSARSTSLSPASKELHLDLSLGHSFSPRSENPQKKRFTSVPLNIRHGMKSSRSRSRSRSVAQNPPGLIVTPKNTTPKDSELPKVHVYRRSAENQTRRIALSKSMQMKRRTAPLS
eukprot:CAMPEP_0117454410 /NCGR_PEP_ID=MMETSP0759-20121206/10782_1 /TAXON_ID=63605 /ORGANISM="Percolomonas cosmopolitus, Strain WS" /LENGTH=1482 /DNA_ID=CAMNT_0005247587 /DNA_START=160 /DNA_END=4604 /DNA_ORIENTATION=-